LAEAVQDGPANTQCLVWSEEAVEIDKQVLGETIILGFSPSRGSEGAKLSSVVPEKIAFAELGYVDLLFALKYARPGGEELGLDVGALKLGTHSGVCYRRSVDRGSLIVDTGERADRDTKPAWPYGDALACIPCMCGSSGRSYIKK
jgi:hypothetical protein